MTLAETILSTDDRPRVEVHAWGQTLYIQAMSGAERDSYDLSLHRARNDGPEAEREEVRNWRARFLVRCLLDDQGRRIFSDDEADALGRKNGETIRRLFEIAQRVNDAGPGAVEEAAKNC